MRPIVSTALLVGMTLTSTAAQAQDVETLLGDGWRLYSEELEFERAAEVFEQAAGSPDASEGQRLEALEYLAACAFALGDPDGARQALRRLLEIDRTQSLHDPSHPPDLLALLEEVRAETGEGDEPPLPEFHPPGEGEGGLDEGEETEGTGTGVQSRDGEEPTTPFVEDGTEDARPPWYRTWWFWTTVGVVVAAGVTTAVALSVSSGDAEPPSGNLDPGVVQLPCSGIRF